MIHWENFVKQDHQLEIWYPSHLALSVVCKALQCKRLSNRILGRCSWGQPLYQRNPNVMTLPKFSLEVSTASCQCSWTHGDSAAAFKTVHYLADHVILWPFAATTKPACPTTKTPMRQVRRSPTTKKLEFPRHKYCWNFNTWGSKLWLLARRNLLARLPHLIMSAGECRNFLLVNVGEHPVVECDRAPAVVGKSQAVFHDEKW